MYPLVLGQLSAEAKPALGPGRDEVKDTRVGAQRRIHISDEKMSSYPLRKGAFVERWAGEYFTKLRGNVPACHTTLPHKCKIF